MWLVRRVSHEMHSAERQDALNQFVSGWASLLRGEEGVDEKEEKEWSGMGGVSGGVGSWSGWRGRSQATHDRGAEERNWNPNRIRHR